MNIKKLCYKGVLNAKNKKNNISCLLDLERRLVTAIDSEIECSIFKPKQTHKDIISDKLNVNIDDIAKEM